MRYKVLPKDCEIDAEVALLQSALALDAAAEIAETNRDVEGLLNVVAMWMKFSEQIQTLAEQAEMAEQKLKEGEMIKSEKSKIKTGFQTGSDPEIIIVEEEESNG